MKIRYDPKADTLTLVLRATPVHESDDSKPGVILDYDCERKLVGIEILNASSCVDNPNAVSLIVGSV